MSIEVLVPPLPESVADATLITWHKQAGEAVDKNESLVDLETDKVTLEVTASQAGILQQILKESGTIVTSGELLALIDEQGEQVPTDTTIAKATVASTVASKTAEWLANRGGGIDEDFQCHPQHRPQS